MLVKFPVAIVSDLRASKDGQSQYVTVREPGGAEYQFSARPNDPEYPCDAVARLKAYADTFDKCEIEAEVRGFMWSGDGDKPKQLMTLRKLSARPLPQGQTGSAAPAK